MRDSKAALDLMYRRSRCLADFDTANKNLDRARAKNKEVQQAEATQQNIKKKFETISEKAKDGRNERFCTLQKYLCYFHIELNDFKTRRVQMFRKNLVELTELQIKHTKVRVEMTFLANSMILLGSNSNDQRCFTTIRSPSIIPSKYFEISVILFDENDSI